MTHLVPNIPRINTALAEWLACLVIVLAARKRFKHLPTFLLSSVFLSTFVLYHHAASTFPLILWVPGMLGAVAMMFSMLLLLSTAPVSETLLHTVRAFILAEFAASLSWQLSYFGENNLGLSFAHIQLLTLLTCYVLTYTIAYFVERRYRRIYSTHPVRRRETFSVLLIGGLIFLSSNMSFLSPNTPLSGSEASDIFLIRTLIDLCGLVMLYAFQEQRRWMHARLEISAMQNILNRHYEQYRFSKENIDFLNHRFHDLKYHIAALRVDDNPCKKNDYLNNMEKALKHFEMQFDTGSKPLDILLAGKSQTLVDLQVNFTFVADGALLSGLELVDLYSIFGNALDNAIESVAQLEDPEKRIIHVSVFAQNDFLVMRFENYYENALCFEDGVIMTTKEDRRQHGFGIKSIRKAAAKYGGEVQISAEDSWFILSVLVPRNELENNPQG